MSKRKLWSYKEELLTKSRESMLCAVQTFNNPNIQFKSETYVVLSIIAWTYLMHAYYRMQRIDYRYSRLAGNRKRFDRTARGAFKYWELQRCLDNDQSPIDGVTATNLRFLIGLRHEIEHQMTTKIDDYLSAKFQACCINYNSYIKTLFGNAYGIDKHLSFSLQFSSLSRDQVGKLEKIEDLPKNISTYVSAFDDNLPDEQFNDVRYSYRVFYVPKVANRKGQADKVIEFIKPDSPEAAVLNREYVLIKDREKPKHLAKYVIGLMRQEGFQGFGPYQHTQLWRHFQAKEPDRGYGVSVEGTWYWYDTWVEEVRKHCLAEGNRYRG